VEDRILRLKDKIDTKEKTEFLDKRLKNCKRNMQELCDSIKRSNLQIMGIKEGEEAQAKGICNIFNKVITEKFSNLKKDMTIQVEEASRTPNTHDQNNLSMAYYT
jgi:hypothetical protein